ncbi:MAG: long-chain fatty acid--CoA ligase [Duodenibacillus sp.]|nr:long-chain fatty acid--CoA ligase [Duodenibacillus sp.]
MQDEFSIARAARERPDAVFVRAGERDITFAEVAAMAASRLGQIERPRPGRPYMLRAAADLDTLVTVCALLEARIPMALVHAGLTAPERQVLEDIVNGIEDPLQPGDCAIIFTSGTTGRPKPAVLTRSALLASAASSNGKLPLAPGDVWLWSLSPARIGGFSIVTRSLASRSALAVASKFSPRDFVRRMDGMGVTVASLVPTMLIKLLDEEPEWRPSPALRAILVGGAALTPALRRRALERGIPVMTTYGMTETCSNVVLTPYEQRMEPVEGAGTVNDGAEVKFVDGRILVRGPMRMRGYWGQEPLAPRDWFDTGDMGYRDAGGVVHMQQRRTDLILTGGENVYPSEVEAALEDMPGVKTALVLGLPDAVWGAIVTALIVPAAGGPAVTPQALAGFLRPRLARYKSPRRFALVGQLPVTAGGKPDRSAAALDGLDLQAVHYT